MNNPEELSENNQVSSQIAKILSLDPVSTLIEFERKGKSNAIKDILKSNQKNKKLALYLIGEVDSNYFKLLSSDFRSDNDIVLLAIKRNSINFEYIDASFKPDINIAKQVINSMLRESKDFFMIKEFISKNFINNESELLEFYEKNLSKYSNILLDDLSKLLLALSKDNDDFVKKLKSQKLIISKRKRIIINPDFIDDFNDYFSKIEGFNLKSKQEQISIKRTKLINDFGLHDIKLNDEYEYIINLIIELSFVNDEQNKIEQENKENKKHKKDNDKNEEKSLKKDKNIDEKDLFIKDRMDLILPNYSYYSSGDYFNIVTNENINIRISNSEKESFSSKALENFIEFYKLLYKLGLNFLWDKYNGNFKTLLAFKGISFNYTIGEGIGETTTLKVLNLIGKNIGVPEIEVLVNDGDPIKELRCFKTIADARLMFEDIKSSSIINGEHIETSMNIGAVEKKLSLENKIDFVKGEINISKW